MSKRVGAFICILLSIICGIIIWLGVARKNKKVEIGQSEKNLQSQIITTTSNEQDVILPSEKLVMKQHYKKCGHTVTNEFPIPEDIVNMTKEQVEKYYFGWNIEKFSEKELIINRDYPGICEEHYIVRDSQGSVNVYSKNDKGEESIVYATDVNTKYLPKEDREKLQNGIEIIGKDNLYTLLEDYE